MVANILLLLWIWLMVEIEKSKVIDETYEWF
jgi:hypothetical protein